PAPYHELSRQERPAAHAPGACRFHVQTRNPAATNGPPAARSAEIGRGRRTDADRHHARRFAEGIRWLAPRIRTAPAGLGRTKRVCRPAIAAGPPALSAE